MGTISACAVAGRQSRRSYSAVAPRQLPLPQLWGAHLQKRALVSKQYAGFGFLTANQSSLASAGLRSPPHLRQLQPPRCGLLLHPSVLHEAAGAVATRRVRHHLKGAAGGQLPQVRITVLHLEQRPTQLRLKRPHVDLCRPARGGCGQLQGPAGRGETSSDGASTSATRASRMEEMSRGRSTLPGTSRRGMKWDVGSKQQGRRMLWAGRQRPHLRLN